MFNKIFEDKIFLSYIIKAACVIGPGFITIGYFESQLFLDLDWLKLVSLSIAFSSFFVLPAIGLAYLDINFLPWKLKFQLNRLKKQAVLINTKLAEFSVETNDTTLDMPSNTDDLELAKLRKKIHQLFNKIANAEETMAKRNIDFYAVIIKGPILFIAFFMVVLTQISIDYLLNYDTTTRDFLEILIWSMWVALPLFAVGNFLCLKGKLLTKRKFLQLTFLITGTLLMSVSFVIINTKATILSFI